MSLSASAVVHVAYHQMLVQAENRESHVEPPSVSEGRPLAARRNAAAVWTGTHPGPVEVEVRLLSEEPHEHLSEWDGYPIRLTGLPATQIRPRGRT
jgi:hypothetical protein